MTGGDGNDIYVVDNASDSVVETNTSPAQIDTVQASVSWTLGATWKIWCLPVCRRSTVTV